MKVEINKTKTFRFTTNYISQLFVAISGVRPRFRQDEVSVAFVDDRTMRQLNKQYRLIDKVTDVLSFAELGSMSSKHQTTYLGEIIIAYPYARKQARLQKHSLKSEIVTLLIHGFLHLVGYDHMTKAQEAVMKKWEQRILMEFEKMKT